ncbi:MAG: mannitol dehydrogenase family protein [Lachnospiraceae bacterium]|nr:mannitol dehydrogenase family protein [Lachnospiraceae bacterium]
MRLDSVGIKDQKAWEDKGYELPKFDRQAMIAKTKENPFWVHFGAGNIFRAFQAAVAQKLLNEGVIDRGITVVEGFDYEIIEKMYRPHDDLSILVTLKADGNVEKTVVGSIAESCILDSENEVEFDRLKEIFRKDSLQFATFTITEKGYSLHGGNGQLLPAVEEDLMNGPVRPSSYMGKVAALLYERYRNGAKPIAMVSTDNCSHNGDKLAAAIGTFAKEWAANQIADKGFVDYVNDESKVSFPWTMIDKITPRPDPTVEEVLKKDDIEGLDNVITSKNTYVAPFVNAEECEYLVIEDKFPNKREPLEKGGFIFTDKETVDKVERMKVCTCLNPLHTALAVYGCLLGYTKIADEMKDEDLKKLVMGIGYREGLPVVTDPGVIDPKEFIDTVVNVRIPNPFMPDTPQRIATDTSQKLPIRYGETIKNYIKTGRNIRDLKLIPLVFAGWFRYLLGIDDEGNEFELSSDPMIDTIRPYVADLKIGESSAEEAKTSIDPLLSEEKIFGTDLKSAGLSELVKEYFAKLISGKGAVRKTLKEYV